MKLSMALLGRVLFLASALVLTGCPSGQSVSDEEKEPHFLAGKSRVNAMDYQGAIESFQKALEVNPGSASAHFELAWLYERRDPDPAAAIYHYDQYLKLRPKAGNASLVQQRILACKQELARQVSLGPLTDNQRRDLEKLAEDNKKLTEENKRLLDEVTKWRAYFGARTNVQPAAAGPARQSPPLAVLAQPQPSPAANAGFSGASEPTRGSTATPSTRTHVVKQGETLAGIARQYHVKLDALQAANPGVDPRKLRLGQTINVP